MTTAMQRAESHVAAAFRPERKERTAFILSGHKIKALVQAGRYPFPEACRLFGIAPGQIEEAHEWLRQDNYRLNRVYDTEVHGLTVEDLFMKAFFSHEEACLESNVVPFAVGAA
jgi:hypothetical protein